MVTKLIDDRAVQIILATRQNGGAGVEVSQVRGALKWLVDNDHLRLAVKRNKLLRWQIAFRRLSTEAKSVQQFVVSLIPTG